MKFYTSDKEYQEALEVASIWEEEDEVDSELEDTPEETPVAVADVEDVAAAKVVYTRLPNGALVAHRSS